MRSTPSGSGPTQPAAHARPDGRAAAYPALKDGACAAYPVTEVIRQVPKVSEILGSDGRAGLDLYPYDAAVRYP
jgi:hypothetical protein